MNIWDLGNDHFRDRYLSPWVALTLTHGSCRYPLQGKNVVALTLTHGSCRYPLQGKNVVALTLTHGSCRVKGDSADATAIVLGRVLRESHTTFFI